MKTHEDRPHKVIFTSRGAMAHFEDGKNEFYRKDTREYEEIKRDRMPKVEVQFYSSMKDI